MEEIEVGEYVRTPYFNIEKVERIDKAKKPFYDDMVITDCNAFSMSWLLNRNVKHSKEIIDLVEEGDYVNGKRVIYVASIENKDDEEELCVFVEETQDCIEAKDIKSIVTKEMYKNIEYRLE